MGQSEASPRVVLPEPIRDGPVSFEAALDNRRSVRKYAAKALTLAEVSQLLWAAQGITHDTHLRTTPSAGALFPLEVYLIAGRVDGLVDGVYRYSPLGHHLVVVGGGEKWSKLWSTVLSGREVKESAAVLAITAVYERTTSKYGERAKRYVHIEVGHAVQNVYLQAAALGIATVVVGSFTDAAVSGILECPETERPMVLMPVGWEYLG